MWNKIVAIPIKIKVIHYCSKHVIIIINNKMSKSIDGTNDLDTINDNVDLLLNTAHLEDVPFDTGIGIDLDVGGNLVCDSTVFSLTHRSTAPTGIQNALQPAISHNSDSNSGVYFPLTDDVGIATGGIERLLINNTNMNASVEYTNTAQPCMIRRKSGTQSIATGAEVTVDYDVELINQNTSALSESAGVITVNSVGNYLVTAEVVYEPDAASTFRSIRILHSGTGTESNFRWGYVSTNNFAGSNIRLLTTAVIPICCVGDTIEVVVGHGAAGNIDIGNIVDANKMEMSIVKLC